MKNASDQDTEVMALNVEAETFIKHLMYVADDKNLETIMKDIIKMDFDNQSMFEFLIALELHVSIY